MARTWLSVTVELLGGRGKELWPWPGRVFAVGPSHTFMDLADAINDAFGRWDRSHLSMFTLADGQVVTDESTGVEMAESAGGPISAPLDIESAKVAKVLQPGAEFQFTFDLGDEWTHRCVIAEEKIDPVEALGIRPDTPLPYWGWGAIPDQYGRRWTSDDGESRPPRRPSQPHPMLLHAWPAREAVADAGSGCAARIDCRQGCGSIPRRGDGMRPRRRAATGGSGVPMALQQRRD